MKIIVFGAVVGAVVCLLVFVIIGAVVAFLNGVDLGHAIYAPPHSLDAAAVGALLYLTAGGAPSAGIGLTVGGIVGTAIHLYCWRNRQRGQLR
jgi:hypothetical protein